MIIGLVGFIGSGKDTVANQLVELGCVRDSFATPLKDACAAIFGWPRELLEGDTIESREFRETPDMFWTRKLGIDNFTPRLALQLIGTDVMRKNFHEDIWLSSLEYRFRKLADSAQHVVVSDVRFRNELELIKSLGGKIIWIQRGDLPQWYDDAVKANDGNAIARKIMQTRWRDVHRSEWDWAGFPPDFVIQNDGSLAQLADLVNNITNDLLSVRLKIV
jgi:hypothetical protein